jgi:sterol desaturase/sphingolipid hydroxylase (fatty acid hydroxylase superfamily)
MSEDLASPAQRGGRRPLHGLARAFAVLGFPLSVVVAFAAFFALLSAGADPVLATGPPIAAHYTFLALTERWLPWQRSWLHSKRDLRTDIGLFITNGVIGAVLGPLVLVGATALGVWLSNRYGIGLWPTAWPLLVQLPVALVVAELVEYSFHRAMHEVPWLWRFHATHHSANRLYWLNAARFHPVDLFAVGVIKMVPLALLGAAAPVLAMVNLFSAVHGAFQHANVPVRLGPLNWIFSMTELHRWHHSPVMAESNHNYGGNLIVWDVIFGTRWLPEDRDPPEAIGMETLPDFPTGFWANLAAPFRWRKVVAEASGVPPAR